MASPKRCYTKTHFCSKRNAYICRYEEKTVGMPRKNLHEAPFDEGTITKLEIFEAYAGAWLPTFIMSGSPDLFVYDFFAGTGYDIKGVEGSPIRILKQIQNQIHNVFQKKTSIHFIVNELDKTKFVQLQTSCNEFISNSPELTRAGIDMKYYNRDAGELFDELFPEIGKNPSLVYMDQNGVKFASDKYILGLAQKQRTDFMFFLSSSYVIRFGETTEFKKAIDVDVEACKNNPYKYIHKNLVEQFQKKLPKGSKVVLAPFSIKKGSNIYGIIFGASHPRALDKFLKIAWSENSINGSANFDIDDDVSKYQLSLFDDQPLTKIGAFKKDLREHILNGTIKNNKDAYLYTLSKGHLDTHAKEEIMEMKRNGLISYPERLPKVNYAQVYDKESIVVFTVNTKE